IADAGREQLDVVTDARCSEPEVLRGDKYEIRGPEELDLAVLEPPGGQRTRRQVVDAVVDRQYCVQVADEIVDHGGREKGPDDRTHTADHPHPSANGASEDPAVHPAGPSRVGKGQRQRRVDGQVLPFLPNASAAPAPVSQTLSES